ncbi:MAG: hypothetical protein ACJ790_10695 [Myxococcaceae bacterium]
MKKILTVAVCSFVLGGIATHAIAAEPQPMMQKALKNLEQALGDLESATHDKGGHRAKAAQLVKDAIAEVKAGMEFDNKH